MSASFQSNQQLQCQMQAEKSLCSCSVRELEARLLDVQDRLMQKVREVAAAREVQTSLRTEIESYKALIECQEKKYVVVLLSYQLSITCCCCRRRRRRCCCCNIDGDGRMSSNVNNETVTF